MSDDKKGDAQGRSPSGAGPENEHGQTKSRKPFHIKIWPVLSSAGVQILTVIVSVTSERLWLLYFVPLFMSAVLFYITYCGIEYLKPHSSSEPPRETLSGESLRLWKIQEKRLKEEEEQRKAKEIKDKEDERLGRERAIAQAQRQREHTERRAAIKRNLTPKQKGDMIDVLGSAKSNGQLFIIQKTGDNDDKNDFFTQIIQTFIDAGLKPEIKEMRDNAGPYVHGSGVNIEVMDIGNTSPLAKTVLKAFCEANIKAQFTKFQTPVVPPPMQGERNPRILTDPVVVNVGENPEGNLPVIAPPFP